MSSRKTKKSRNSKSTSVKAAAKPVMRTPSIQSEDKFISAVYNEFEKVALRMMENHPDLKKSDNPIEDIFWAGMMIGARFAAEAELPVPYFMGIAYEMCGVMENLQHAECPHCKAEAEALEDADEDDHVHMGGDPVVVAKEKLN